jgi:hypothetical protein
MSGAPANKAVASALARSGALATARTVCTTPVALFIRLC